MRQKLLVVADVFGFFGERVPIEALYDVALKTAQSLVEKALPCAWAAVYELAVSRILNDALAARDDLKRISRIVYLDSSYGFASSQESCVSLPLSQFHAQPVVAR